MDGLDARPVDGCLHLAKSQEGSLRAPGDSIWELGALEQLEDLGQRSGCPIVLDGHDGS